MSIFSPPQILNEECIELNLEFDAPQWGDLEREKVLVEQGIGSFGSDIHDDWFKKVHPLHEAATNDNDQTHKKSVVDRKGNKLSLGVPIKTAPAKKFDKEVPDSLKATRTTTSQSRKSSGSDHENNNAKKPRKCWDLNGSHAISISPRTTDQPKHSITKHGTTDIDSSNDVDEELRTMLATHNRRIMKQRAEYDENGRKIQKGNPVTCPAPTKTQSNINAKLKSKRRSVNVLPVRPETLREAKQKRRSCFTLSAMREISPKPSQKTTPNHTTTTMETTGSNNHKIKINRQKSVEVAEKQTRKTTDAENEIKELIAQHNSKLAAKKATK